MCALGRRRRASECRATVGILAPMEAKAWTESDEELWQAGGCPLLSQKSNRAYRSAARRVPGAHKPLPPKMKGMRAMKAKKPVSARLAKRHVFFGKRQKTATGLQKDDLVQNKNGRIVSKKKSALGKKNSWILACTKARAFMKIAKFSVIKKGTELYVHAKRFHLYEQIP